MASPASSNGRRAGADHGQLFADLKHRSDREVAERSGLPLAWVGATRSFYDLLKEPDGNRVCTGTACSFERHQPAGGRAHGEAVARCLYAVPENLRRDGQVKGLHRRQSERDHSMHKQKPMMSHCLAR